MSLANRSDARFPRVRHGYDPESVDPYVDELGRANREYVQEIELLRSQLREMTTEITRMRHEATVMSDSSPTPKAMTDRIAKMLRLAVDEVSEMQFEARQESEQLLALAQAEADASLAKSRQMIAELSSRQRALETEYAEVMTKAREEAARITAEAVNDAERARQVDALRRQQAEDELDSELLRMRRETETRLEEQLRLTTQECEARLLDAKAESERRIRVAGEQIDRRLQEARRALDSITSKRIAILEQLMQIHGTLEGIPTILESAYREAKVTPEAGLVPKNLLEEIGWEDADLSDSRPVSANADGHTLSEE